MKRTAIDFQGVKFLPVDLEDALELAISYIQKGEGDYFCFSNIHLAMEGIKNSNLRTVLNSAAANFPDGMGVAKALKIIGYEFGERVRGTDFMLKLCEYAATKGLRIFLYGNTRETLEALNNKLRNMFPDIAIAGSISPPFRPLTREEDDVYVDEINRSGADILFVSLGAPKQERWMAAHQGRLKSVQFGVGAAFSFITGNVRQAPRWMQKTGLEWLYRLPQEPRKTIYRMSLVPEFLGRLFLQILTRNNS